MNIRKALGRALMSIHASAYRHQRGHHPFNFPAMIPLWMSGVAIATGCAFIIKPSARSVGPRLRLAELFLEAGLPAGIVQVVRGDKEMVDRSSIILPSAR